jgi:hypothetical protein
MTTVKSFVALAADVKKISSITFSEMKIKLGENLMKTF